MLTSAALTNPSQTFTDNPLPNSINNLLLTIKPDKQVDAKFPNFRLFLTPSNPLQPPPTPSLTL